MLPTGARNAALGAALAAVYCALTWWLVGFRAEFLDTRLPSDLGDPVLVLYFLEWGARSLARGVRGYLEFWDAGFYFPVEGVMAMSEHLLGPAALVSLLGPLRGEGGVAGYNLLFLGSFVLSGLATTWVARQAGASLGAALLAGIVFAFSPYRFDQQAHLQMLLVQFLPLVLWLLHRLLEEPDLRHAVAFFAAYTLHVTGGLYLAYFVHLALGLLLLAHAGRWRSWWSPRPRRLLLATAAACGAVAALVFAPYVVLSARLGLERSLHDFAYYGATVLSYLSPGARNSAWGGLLAPLLRPENQLFAGVVATALAAIGIAALWARSRPRLLRVGGQVVRRLDSDWPPPLRGWRRGLVAALAAIAVLGFLLGDLTTLVRSGEIAPGEVPGWLVGYRLPALLIAGAAAVGLWCSRRWRRPWPLDGAGSAWDRGLLSMAVAFVLLSFPVVFVPLASVVPGLDGLRVPTRVYPFVSLALALFAARGLDTLLARMRARHRPVLLAAALAVLVWEVRAEVLWHPWPKEGGIPPIYHRIAELPEIGAVLHLPLPANPALESHYMYYSIAHWRPIVNGYSGYQPAPYLEVRRRVEHELFEPGTLDYLSDLGVTHVAVHPLQFRMPAERRRLLRWERTFASGDHPRLLPEMLVGRDRLYRIAPEGAGAPAGR